jgi:hypothetical protein
VKKRSYRTIPIHDLHVDTLLRSAAGGRITFAVDVAKVDMVAAFVADGRVLATVRWKSPHEKGLALAALTRLRDAGLQVEVAMEPSGTYGDVLRHQLHASAFSVFRVSGKRTHDAAEVYDGGPSLGPRYACLVRQQGEARRRQEGQSCRGGDAQAREGSLPRGHSTRRSCSTSPGFSSLAE